MSGTVGRLFEADRHEPLAVAPWGQPRVREAVARNAEHFWQTWLFDERANCRLWTQDLYGRVNQRGFDTPPAEDADAVVPWRARHRHRAGRLSARACRRD